MELDWSTFFLEIINFLVLVWLLRHFLYRPVLAAIARRQQNVQNSLDAAQSIQTEAAALQTRYEQRMADWQQERDRQRAALESELQTERQSRLAEMSKELEAAREQARAEDRRHWADTRAVLEDAAREQGAAFASRLLGELAGPQLENLLVDMTLRHLRTLPDDSWQKARAGIRKGPGSATVSSAFPLGGGQRQQLEHVLAEKLGVSAACDYQTDSSLICGLEIALGHWVLAANLRDELRAFSGRLRHE